MNLERVEIENFRPISNMELLFEPGVNLILGNNGVAKTSILEALTIGLGDYLSGVQGTEKRGIADSDVRVEIRRMGSASQGRQQYFPARITSGMRIHDNEQTNQQENSETGNTGLLIGEVRRDTPGGRTKYSGKDLSKWAKVLTNDINASLPLLAYYSTKRLLAPKQEDFKPGKNKLDDRRCGYIGCLNDGLDTKALKAWCMKMEMVSFQTNAPVAEYEAFKKTVSDFMMVMNELEQAPVIGYSRAFEDITYSEKGEELPINYLSAGYQSMLWMVMDMAFRLAQLNPEMKDQHEAEGIVLIDEIDMHLHPKWQWKILEAFGKTFPHMQIIATTHAPIVISACKEGKLIYINERREVEYPESAYASSIQDVVELTQGSYGIPRQLQEEYDRFEQAFACRKQEEARQILSSMSLHYGEDNTQVKKANRKMNMRKGW